MVYLGPKEGYELVPIDKVRTHRLAKLAILNHHRSNDSQEALVAREYAGSSRQGIALHHTLTSMLRQNFNDSSVIVSCIRVPFEFTIRHFKDSIQFVTGQFIRRPYPEEFRIPALDQRTGLLR